MLVIPMAPAHWGVRLCLTQRAVAGQANTARGTHSGIVLEDISLLKASWYLRLSTSFFIWGTSHSSIASGASEVASLRLVDKRSKGAGSAAAAQDADSACSRGLVPIGQYHPLALPEVCGDDAGEQALDRATGT